MKSGDELQVPGTPTIFLDGQPVPAQALADASTEQSLKTYLKRRAAYKAYVAGKPLTFNKPDQVAKVGEIYEMTLKTSQGDVVLELDPKLAPVNVNSTVFLAQKGYFKGMNVALNDPDVHAILLQDPSNTGFGSPGYDCDAELPAAGAFATAGTVALFRSPGPDSNSSGTQIIITHGDASALDGQFTVIGKVTKGLDIVTKLVADDGKGAGDKVISVSVSKKG
jgi:peptidyl-prolyl cis-trans isomerase B (cyclophilin B)